MMRRNSSLKNSLRNWEGMLTDKGFEGMKYLNIITTSHDGHLGSTLAHHRIWVECNIGKIKRFRICEGKIHIPPSKQGDLLEFVRKIWTIASEFALGFAN